MTNSNRAKIPDKLRRVLSNIQEGGSSPGGSVAWADVTGKPATFPPDAHGHSDVVAAGASGFMSGSDKSKLDGIAPGAQVNVATDLAYTASTRALTSSTGTDVTLPLVGADPGLMSAADKTKLDGVATGATANSSDASLRDRATHTGTQTASTISDFATAVAATAAVTANTAKVSNATHTGDVTGSTALTIANDAVTYAKMQNVSAASKLLGRGDSGSGDPQEITLGTNLTMSGTTLNASGGGATNLTYTASTRVLASDTGTDATLPLFTSTEAGLVPASGGGTANFLRADGTFAAPPAGGSLALTDLTDVTITSSAEGQSLVRGATEFINQTLMTVTLGPFKINDMAGTATTDAGLGYFNTATAVSRSTNEIKMQTAGRVVGAIITSDAARTAGTATVAVEVNNGTQAFNSGAVALDATNTTSDSSFVAWGSGVSFNAGDTLGAEVTTSGWTPTTANFSIWLVVMLKF